MTRRTRSQAVKRKRRYTLRPLWKSAKVESVAGGWLVVFPQWTQRKPGVLMRLAAAQRLQGLIDAQLKRRK